MLMFMMTRECMGRVWREVCRWRFHEAEEVGPCLQPAFHHVKSLASTTCQDHEHQCSSWFYVYLMFCRRLECYNPGGCVLVESRPINKLCFRRIWRGWDFLSNQFLRRMWRRITKSWREGVGSEQPERDRSILRWSGKWMKINGEGQHFWLRKCKKSDHPPVSTFHPP